MSPKIIPLTLNVLVAIVAVGLGSVALWTAAQHDETIQLTSKLQDELSAGAAEKVTHALTVDAVSDQPRFLASIGAIDRSRALLSLTTKVNPSARTELATVAKKYLKTAAMGQPATARLWRSFIVAELISAGPTPRLGALSGAALQLDGGNPFTVITLVELAIRYPQIHSADVVEALLSRVGKLESYRVMRRPLGRLYAGLEEEDRHTLLSVSKNPKQIERWARPYLN